MKYFVEKDYEEQIEIPKDIQKQIVSDHLEKYYITSLFIGIFIIGFLLGVVASA
jgi:hypothetical protein